MKGGHDLLFDVDTFDKEIEAASEKFQFPAEVSTVQVLELVQLKKDKLIGRCYSFQSSIPMTHHSKSPRHFFLSCSFHFFLFSVFGKIHDKYVIRDT